MEIIYISSEFPFLLFICCEITVKVPELFRIIKKGILKSFGAAPLINDNFWDCPKKVLDGPNGALI